MMYSKQTSKTVEFRNLPERNKAEFIQFLLKNNICFQEGKDESTAHLSVKTQQTPKTPPPKQPLNNIQSTSKQQPFQLKMNEKPVPLHSQPKTKKNKENTLKQHIFKNQSNRNGVKQDKQLKTPTKNQMNLTLSSLSSRTGNKTLEKSKKCTPRSVKPISKKPQINNNISKYEKKAKGQKIKLQNIKHSNSKQNLNSSQQYRKDLTKSREEQHKKNTMSPIRVDICRQKERIENKYAGLFEGLQKGRAVKWPLNILQKTIQEIYDDLFLRNTQCLQTKNVIRALKTLNLTSFARTVQAHFRKRFKCNKLAVTNLQNMLHSLSHHISREGCPVFLKTFQDFLLSRLQHQDTLYYLFARNVLKKELRAIQKTRQISRQGNYFPDSIKSKDISRLLKGIIGKDNELINQYRKLITQRIRNDQILVYQFLFILLEDYHQKRLLNDVNSLECQNADQAFFQRDSHQNHHQELTFGEQHQEPVDRDNHQEVHYEKSELFWNCLTYNEIHDNLFELIMEKMILKTIQLVDILAADMKKEKRQLEQLQRLLFLKSESLVKAVFVMNKMRWFKQLGIVDPTEQDIQSVELIQIKLRQLRQNPSGKDIGQFCKIILTTRQLINELLAALTAND